MQTDCVERNVSGRTFEEVVVDRSGGLTRRL